MLEIKYYVDYGEEISIPYGATIIFDFGNGNRIRIKQRKEKEGRVDINSSLPRLIIRPESSNSVVVEAMEI